ncbi:MAG: hypothetical protein KatS3mg121_0855 [Gammaproteobacteria bacterium]|nr:MAG: hypothetical protein KatS3mg121_0855 [Gammaproteobacteria bacterium]
MRFSFPIGVLFVLAACAPGIELGSDGAAPAPGAYQWSAAAEVDAGALALAPEAEWRLLQAFDAALAACGWRRAPGGAAFAYRLRWTPEPVDAADAAMPAAGLDEPPQPGRVVPGRVRALAQLEVELVAGDGRGAWRGRWARLTGLDDPRLEVHLESAARALVARLAADAGAPCRPEGTP